MLDDDFVSFTSVPVLNSIRGAVDVNELEDVGSKATENVEDVVSFLASIISRKHKYPLKKIVKVMEGSIGSRSLTLDNSKLQIDRDKSKNQIIRSMKRKKQLSNRKRKQILCTLQSRVSPSEWLSSSIASHRQWCIYADGVLSSSTSELTRKSTILKLELLGSLVCVLQSRCNTAVGLTGIVVGVFANSLQIVNQQGSLKRLIREANTIAVLYPDDCILRTL